MVYSKYKNKANILILKKIDQFHHLMV